MEAETLGDTLGDVEAEAMVDTVAETITEVEAEKEGVIKKVKSFQHATTLLSVLRRMKR